MTSQSSCRAFTCAALAVAVGMAGACSSAPNAEVEEPGVEAAAPSAPSSSASPKPRLKRSAKRKAAAKGKHSRSRKASAERKPSPGVAGSRKMRGAEASGSTRGSPRPAGGSTQATGANPSPLATASASVVDPREDAFTSGQSPAYTDLLRAALQGRGRTLQMTMSFAAELPERTRDENEQFIAAISIRDKDGDARWTFGARCSDRGWKPFARSRNKRRRFPGRLSIDATTVRLTIPWSAVKGPHRFEWIASGSWVRTVQDIPSYSVDAAPNGDNAHFPS